MHLVCLGVVRRMLHFLKGDISGTNDGKISAGLMLLISSRLEEFKLPSEFVRQPRSLTHLDRWKATELRSFLLYTGIVALKGVIDVSVYKHFLSLCIAIRLLCESNACKRRESIDAASRLLDYYVNNAFLHYGLCFCTYNVHNLLHIVDDVTYYDSALDDISALEFENYLQKLKKLVHGKHNPLVQVCKRLEEENQLVVLQENKNYKVGVSDKDSWFWNTRGVVNVVGKRANNSYICELYDHVYLDDFFGVFLKSQDVGVFLIRQNIRPSRCLLERASFTRKCVFLPYKDGGKVIISLLQDFV